MCARMPQTLRCVGQRSLLGFIVLSSYASHDAEWQAASIEVAPKSLEADKSYFHGAAPQGCARRRVRPGGCPPLDVHMSNGWQNRRGCAGCHGPHAPRGRLYNAPNSAAGRSVKSRKTIGRKRATNRKRFLPRASNTGKKWPKSGRTRSTSPRNQQRLTETGEFRNLSPNCTISHQSWPGLRCGRPSMARCNSSCCCRPTTDHNTMCCIR